MKKQEEIKFEFTVTGISKSKAKLLMKAFVLVVEAVGGLLGGGVIHTKD